MLVGRRKNLPTREECTSKTDETHKTRSVHSTAAFKLENRSVEPCSLDSANGSEDRLGCTKSFSSEVLEEIATQRQIVEVLCKPAEGHGLGAHPWIPAR